MAGVSLKDLMNPLTKIEQYTKETVNRLDKITDLLVNGVSPETASTKGTRVNEQGKQDPIQFAILTQLESQTIYLKKLADRGGFMSNLFGKNNDRGFNTGGVDALQKLGLGAQDLAKAMIMFRFIPKKIVNNFATSITTIFESLDKVDGNNAKKGADILRGLGGDLLSFSGALAASSLLLIPGIIGVPMLALSIGLVGGTIALLGSKAQYVERGSEALGKVGRGLISFTIGLSVSALATMFILKEPALLAGMALSIGLIGGTIALLGLVERAVDKGSDALIGMGVGLATFSVGYGIFALVSQLSSYEDIMKQAAIIGGVGLTFALVGKFASNMIMGSIAFGLMGLSFIPFALGYSMLADSTKNMEWEDVGMQLALLTGVGTVFGVAGLAAPFIAAGALAFGLAGLGLIGLSYGLKSFQALGWKEQDSVKLATALGGVRLAFTGGSSDDGFFSKIGNVFTGAVDSAAMIAASTGFIAAGISLGSLSKGLTKFKGIGWKNTDSETLGITLSGITAAFAQAGGEPSNPGGLFGAVFGNSFSPNAVERGIDSVMDAGEALSGIAKGLMSFQNLIDSGVTFGEPDGNGRYEKGTLGYSVVNTIGFISQAFAAIANEGNVQGGGFFDSLLSIKRNKVAEGISSVRGVGDELIDIATSLEKFKGIKNMEELSKKVRNVVTFVGDAFATIAGKSQEDSIWFGLISWDENKVEEGIDAVDGAGEELLNISQSLINFQDLKDPTALAAGVAAMFNSISDIFMKMAVDPRSRKMEPVMGQFNDFIETISERASDGDLDKAAKDIKKVANAINSLNIEKTETLTELFKSTANLSDGRNNGALKALAEAVKEIRDTLVEGSDSNNNNSNQVQPAAQTVTTETIVKESPISEAMLNRLESTLASINNTLSNLPGDIATIELKVSDI